VAQSDNPTSTTAPAKLVLVVGSGRSGTSSVAGTLKHLGLHVPQPEVEANETNPQGFFEPRWAVDFHNGLMLQTEINISDARPVAVELARTVCSDVGNVTLLRDWLSEQAAQAPGTDLVVKDPRTTWFQELWREAADPLELAPRVLTMLRHPAEVSGSRQTYYKSREGDARRRAGNAGRIAGWINVNLACESASRESERVFVRYLDLLDDWRKTMRAVRERLELASIKDADWSHPHEVDSFVDPNLRRHEITWEDVDVSEPIRDLAEEVWVQLNTLVDNGGVDAAAQQTLDGLTSEYARIYADAEGMTHDSVAAAAGNVGPRVRRRQARKQIAAASAAADRVTDHVPADSKPGPRARGARTGRASVRPGPGERLGRRIDRIARGIKRRLRR
jgi:hypothetical protein